MILNERNKGSMSILEKEQWHVSIEAAEEKLNC